jgi:hypothetical protein
MLEQRGCSNLPTLRLPTPIPATKRPIIMCIQDSIDVIWMTLPMMKRKTPKVKLLRRPHQSEVYAPERAPKSEPILMSETRMEERVAGIE